MHQHSASLILLLLLLASLWSPAQPGGIRQAGALVRGDSTRPVVSLVFTAHEWGEGLQVIRRTLKKAGLKAGFFFTGAFYRNPAFRTEIKRLQADGHLLGPHSDGHLLYCDWMRRDSLLVTRDSFERDLAANLQAMRRLGLLVKPGLPFIPPFEWWNDSISRWSEAMGLEVDSFTPGTYTAADYTWPGLPNYRSSDSLLGLLAAAVAQRPVAFNGAILLVHAGTDPRRRDKFYRRLREMIGLLRERGYRFVGVEEMIR